MSSTRRVCLLGIFVLILGFASPQVWPQSATTQSTRYIAIVPPGMQAITIAGRTAMCPPDLADPVRAALAKIVAATRPTTMASDLLSQLAAQRSALLTQMSADLLLPQSDIATFLDKTLAPILQQIDHLRTVTHVVVCTQEQLTAAVKAGWHAPMFHYNVLADYTFYEPRISVSTGGDMDDVVIWAPVDDGATPDQVTAAVVKAVQLFEAAFIGAASQQAEVEVRNQTVEFVAAHVIKPLKLPSGQQWLGIGLMRAISCKYAAMITGISRKELVASLMEDNPSNPIRSAPLDLLNGFDTSSIKPQFLPFYVDAMGRKATGVVQKLIDSQGDAVVPKILAALQSGPVPDNQSLVALIQKITGVDVTNDLLPQ